MRILGGLFLTPVLVVYPLYLFCALVRGEFTRCGRPTAALIVPALLLASSWALYWDLVQTWAADVGAW